jgi:hypothetical protein
VRITQRLSEVPRHAAEGRGRAGEHALEEALDAIELPTDRRGKLIATNLGPLDLLAQVVKRLATGGRCGGVPPGLRLAETLFELVDARLELLVVLGGWKRLSLPVHHPVDDRPDPDENRQNERENEHPRILHRGRSMGAEIDPDHFFDAGSSSRAANKRFETPFIFAVARSITSSSAPGFDS